MAEHSAKDPQKTLQLRLHLRLRMQLTQKIEIWDEVIENSITPHSFNFNRPVGPDNFIVARHSLPHEISVIVYCQRKVSPLIDRVLRKSPLTIDATAHLLFNRKQKDIDLVQQYSVLHSDKGLETKMYFLLSKDISDLKQFPKTKTRFKNKRRRSRFRQQLQHPKQ